MTINITKKVKYLILSVLFTSLIYIFSISSQDSQASIAYVTIITLILGIFITQYPNINIRNIASTILFPVHLFLGAILTYIYFPNVSLLFTVASVIVFGALFYIFLLVNNVFLVVEEKEELIPLYRAALTWNQILLIIVAIPYFSGIFKTPFNPFIQNGIVSFSAFLFGLYLIWILKLDKSIKRLKIGESLVLSFLISFFIFFSGLGVSFIPTEPFLKALFVSAFLMFGLSYVNSYLKNDIDKKSILEYAFIIVLFLFILIVFKP